MSTEILGGQLKSHITFSTPEEMAAKVEECRLEQEQIAGYQLVLAGTKQTHYQDDQGHDVYEVWATFKPAPPPQPPAPSNATQV